jgi:hypothetical protein
MVIWPFFANYTLPPYAINYYCLFFFSFLFHMMPPFSVMCSRFLFFLFPIFNVFLIDVWSFNCLRFRYLYKLISLILRLEIYKIMYFFYFLKNYFWY